MTPNEYQQRALRTSPDCPPHIVRPTRAPDVRLTNAALGLTGEAGEFAELIKKWLYHDSGLDKDAAVKELGDVQWYLALAADALGVTLEHVMERNIAKLQSRYPHGFTAEAANAPRLTEAAAANGGQP